MHAASNRREGERNVVSTSYLHVEGGHVFGVTSGWTEGWMDGWHFLPCTNMLCSSGPRRHGDSDEAHIAGSKRWSLAARTGVRITTQRDHSVIRDPQDRSRSEARQSLQSRAHHAKPLTDHGFGITSSRKVGAIPDRHGYSLHITDKATIVWIVHV
ncbi:hypothetical protein LZ30DRAFT_254109 [Colletotrichum cereale]|nr:hypothetical protein LZ30DRAFT_254109 [Colletotrichum cereale]